ncbi:MAG TPA: carboxy-S-adenosyl-L-methionine synthase CmoA [Desulfobacteraceae bacterium]|nr:carboxy-S-adenosyl-L-methionine synthase CmoA [Desulfobacteraceae bacterium]
MKKDRVFAQKQTTLTPFRFNRQVAEVFDDMLVRSVPFYGESLKQQARITQRYYQNGSRIYDLGCSHGNLGILVKDVFENRPFTMVGVDNSKPMIDRYKKRLMDSESDREGQDIQLVCGGMEDLKIEKASVVLINLTLQFLSPKMRDGLIRSIFQGLKPGGIMLLTEKTVHPDSGLCDLELEFYRQFKRENGYSELEISQKRDALEKVLIPEPVAVHEERIRVAGFSLFNVWLKWFNFTSMLAIK